MNKDKQWKLAQEEEWECWEDLRSKLNSPLYFQEKCRYWDALLNKVKLSKEDLTTKKTLEVGCGPTGMFMLLKEGDKKDNFYALDPLLEKYRTIVPDYLNGIQGYSDSMEELDSAKVGQFQSIFAINCIDHCRDMEAFCKKLNEIVAKEGKIYLAVNTHIRDVTANLWRRFQKVLEPLHPYHFTQKEYENLLSEFFKIEEVLDIENEVIEVNNKTSTISISSKREKPPFSVRLKNKLRGLLEKLHPSSFVFWILSKFGLPSHDFKGTGNSIYRHKLFVMSARDK